MPSDSLNADHLKNDLRRRSVRGAAVTVASQVGKFALTAGTTAVLARLLTPADFGLVAMVFTLTGFVDIFRDLGLSTATVQRDRIEHAQVSTLFWLNAAAGVVLAGVTCALAPAIAAFYDEPRLVWVAVALSATFLVSGCNVQHFALLRRNMRYRAIASNELMSQAVGMVAGITAAFLGAGYWALVCQQLARYGSGAIGIWVVSDWRPSGPRSCDFRAVRSMVSFGVSSAANEAIIYCSRNAASVLIGRLAGSAALGLYQRAFQLLLLPVQQVHRPLNAVAIPALSRLQHDPVRYRNYYKKAIVWVVGLGMPAVAFMYVAAGDVVRVMLGPRWDEAVPIFRALAPAAFMGTFNVATGWVFVSLGQSGRQLRWTLVTAPTTIAAVFIGHHVNGTIGVAWAYSIVFCGLTMGPPGIYYCFRQSPLKMRDVCAALWRPVGASLTACAIAAHVYYQLPDDLPALTSGLAGGGELAMAAFRLAVLGPVFGLAYAFIFYALPGGQVATRDMLSALTELRAKKARRGGPGGPPPGGGPTAGIDGDDVGGARPGAGGPGVVAIAGVTP